MLLNLSRICIHARRLIRFNNSSIRWNWNKAKAIYRNYTFLLASLHLGIIFQSRNATTEGMFDEILPETGVHEVAFFMSFIFYIHSRNSQEIVLNISVNGIFRENNGSLMRFASCLKLVLKLATKRFIRMKNAQRAKRMCKLLLAFWLCFYYCRKYVLFYV